jgi:hypothetical protein
MTSKSHHRAAMIHTFMAARPRKVKPPMSSPSSGQPINQTPSTNNI